MKINEKVRIMRRIDEKQGWGSVGQGVVKQLFTDKFGILTFIGYLDKDWQNRDVVEILAVDSKCLKVEVYG